MRFSVQLPTDRVEPVDEFATRDAIFEMARAFERAGFDACYVTDHPAPTEGFVAGGGHHALDPLVALSTAAAATERLLLHANVLVLPYRNPLLAAKAVASLDAVSGGRVILGVAAGYLEEEFLALGADFERRNAICDDALVAMKLAWSGEPVHRAAAHYTAQGNVQLPRPAQDPHPPIWVGGNASVAIRRAARHAQGWSPFPLPAEQRVHTRTAAIESIEDLRFKIEYLNDYAERAGRSERLDVNFVPFGYGMNTRRELDVDAFCDDVAAYEAIGVTWLSIGLPGENRTHVLESAARFGEEVIAPLAARDSKV